MKVIQNRILPFGRRYAAINLCGVVFAKCHLDEISLYHEAIHSAQVKELLVVGFYLWYVLEWLFRTIQYRDSYRGYLIISFEKEAYANQHNLNYLKSRRHFAFLSYRRK